MTKVVIIDDDAAERAGLTEAITTECQDADVVAYEGDTPLEDGDSYETHVGKWLDSLKDTIGLIVCDKELGRYPNLKGLSANPVSAAAIRRAIPFCQYSRQPSQDVRELGRFNRLRQWSSEQITLDGLEVEEWATQINSLYRGFESIRTQYRAMDKTVLTPASALAKLLEHPESESRIALYGAGDQGFLSEIMTFFDPAESNPNMDDLYARMPRVLGNWLFLSILRFPGILVNEIAAASYLNIAEDDFSKPNIRSCFDDVQYRGPFHDHKLGPWWWRDDLDSLINEAGEVNGRAYVVSKGHKDVRQCVDEQTHERAGYYCMLMHEPVSSKNSRGDINWFPSGADLARIRKDKFDKITALIGSF